MLCIRVYNVQFADKILALTGTGLVAVVGAGPAELTVVYSDSCK